MASYYYNKASKKWSVRFLCFQNGKRVYKRLSGFAKRSDAIDNYTLVINQYKNPSREQSVNVKFSDAVEKYLLETALHTKESTVVDKQSVFKFHILPYFANKKLDEITKNLLNDWQTEIWTKKRENGQKYSHKYLKKYSHYI